MCENCSRVRFGAHVRVLHERLDVSHDQKHSYRRLCCLHCVAAAVLRFLNNSKGFQNILSAVRTDAILWNTFLLIRHSSALNKTCLQWKGAQVIIPNWLKMVYISLFLFANTGNFNLWLHLPSAMGSSPRKKSNTKLVILYSGSMPFGSLVRELLYVTFCCNVV